MTTKNDITGDALVSKTSTEAYRDGYDRIFGKKPVTLEDAIAYVNSVKRDRKEVLNQPPSKVLMRVLDEDDGAPE